MTVWAGNEKITVNSDCTVHHCKNFDTFNHTDKTNTKSKVVKKTKMGLRICNRCS